jgi:probable phosphoglycerate mutase
MKKIYIIRHGQTEYNRLGLTQGASIDSSLNDVGREQARAFFAAHGHINFDKVYTSNLKRTWQTVHHFTTKGLAHEKSSHLNEISWGEKEGRPLTEEDDRLHFKMLEGWKKGHYYLKAPAGESPLALQERQRKVIQLFKERDDEKNILVCTHGRAMRILFCTMLGLPLYNMDSFKHQNLCLYVLEYNGKRFSLKVKNEISHLKNIIAQK